MWCAPWDSNPEPADEEGLDNRPPSPPLPAEQALVRAAVRSCAPSPLQWPRFHWMEYWMAPGYRRLPERARLSRRVLAYFSRAALVAVAVEGLDLERGSYNSFASCATRPQRLDAPGDHDQVAGSMSDVDVATLAELLHETADHHDAFETATPPHNWRKWYGPYLEADCTRRPRTRRPRRPIETSRSVGCRPAVTPAPSLCTRSHPTGRRARRTVSRCAPLRR